MAMLPAGKNEKELAVLCQNLRAFYDEIRKETPSVNTLSVGMSGDYKIAIKNGSNMIRLSVGRAYIDRRQQARAVLLEYPRLRSARDAAAKSI